MDHVGIAQSFTWGGFEGSLSQLKVQQRFTALAPFTFDSMACHWCVSDRWDGWGFIFFHLRCPGRYVYRVGPPVRGPSLGRNRSEYDLMVVTGLFRIKNLLFATRGIRCGTCTDKEHGLNLMWEADLTIRRRVESLSLDIQAFCCLLLLLARA
ncbi:hypothetical protein Tco_0872891 [Tanacetum coccineum]